MNVISRKRLLEYHAAHAAARRPLENWYAVARKAKWTCLDDVRRTFASADDVTVDSGRVITVFNVGGGNYRLLTSTDYPRPFLYIKRLLTHAEYDKEKWKATL